MQILIIVNYEFPPPSHFNCGRTIFVVESHFACEVWNFLFIFFIINGRYFKNAIRYLTIGWISYPYYLYLCPVLKRWSLTFSLNTIYCGKIWIFLLILLETEDSICVLASSQRTCEYRASSSENFNVPEYNSNCWWKSRSHLEHVVVSVVQQ